MAVTSKQPNQTGLVKQVVTKELGYENYQLSYAIKLSYGMHNR